MESYCLILLTSVVNFLIKKVIYIIHFPQKSGRNLGTRIKEHCGLDKNSPIFNHLAERDFLPVHP